MALSDESDGSDGSDDYDDALPYRIAPPIVAMVGVTHLSGTETIQLIVKSGERSTPTGVPAF